MEKNIIDINSCDVMENCNDTIYDLQIELNKKYEENNSLLEEIHKLEKDLMNTQKELIHCLLSILKS